MVFAEKLFAICSLKTLGVSVYVRVAHVGIEAYEGIWHAFQHADQPSLAGPQGLYGQLPGRYVFRKNHNAPNPSRVIMPGANF
jgi:hypothetical protein